MSAAGGIAYIRRIRARRSRWRRKAFDDVKENLTRSFDVLACQERLDRTLDVNLARKGRTLRCSSHHDLPARLFARERRGKLLYYYRAGGKWIALGSDRNEALRRWSEFESTTAPGSFIDIAERYRRDVLPDKSIKTQKNQAKELDRLIEAFGHAQIGQIEPKHVREYRDKRSAKVAGNREVALLSHVYNRAREWGFTAAQNPVEGVTKNREHARGVYVTDAMFKAVYSHADGALQDAMDLAVLIGQRVADVLGARRSDARDGYLEVRQRKTGKPLRFELTPELQRIIDRATGRERKVASVYILADGRGRPLNYNMLRNRFDAAREAADPALSDWQFRDLRAKTGRIRTRLQPRKIG